MTLDEAINFYERQTEALYKAIPCDGCPFDKCKEEHRQLLEWLKELKEYRDDCDYKTLKIKLENAEDIIRGLQEDLRDAREELRWR